jgi:hypothetical protein
VKLQGNNKIAVYGTPGVKKGSRQLTIFVFSGYSEQRYSAGWWFWLQLTGIMLGKNSVLSILRQKYYLGSFIHRGSF